jgi:hypothetical protein
MERLKRPTTSRNATRWVSFPLCALCCLSINIKTNVVRKYINFLCLTRPKYGITENRSGYRGTMRLIVRNFAQSDVGTYHCVSTNSLGKAEGTLRLYGKRKKLNFLFTPGLSVFPDSRWGSFDGENVIRL